MSLADDIRRYCKETYVDPARKRGEKTVVIRSLGLGGKYPSPNIHSMDDYKMKEIIGAVCKRLGAAPSHSKKMWDMSSDILHGRDSKIKLETDKVMRFIKETFNLVERVYRS